MDVKDGDCHIVGVPQALAAFIVTMIMFSKPRIAGIHSVFFPDVCLDYASAQCWDSGGSLVLGHINLLNDCGNGTAVT